MRFDRRFLGPIIDDNPEPALIMAAAVIAVLIYSNVAVSALRSVMPRSIRLIIEVTLVASAVIVVDEMLKVYAPDSSRVLTIFVGLIITNCIVLGRAESFALHNRVLPSLADALNNGAGYAVILLTRELLGNGSLLNVSVLPDAFPRNDMMQYAPSAFFILGLVVWAIRSWRPEQAEQPGHAAEPVSYQEVR
jgi:Na+-transporting NADH:ubiquinone oxidoreductase subunit D